LDMSRLRTIAKQFGDDENGAAMIEYAILIGIVATAIAGCAIIVGNYVSYSWLKLATAIGDRFPQ
jgi:pilus assembly protein Flp/PilA